MNDTATEVAERYRALILQRSASDRLKMACGMFDCARQLMLAGIKARWPDIPDTELRVRVFERMYGRDYTPDEHDRIAACLRRKSG
jgi:hypothetical protein